MMKYTIVIVLLHLVVNSNDLPEMSVYMAYDKEGTMINSIQTIDDSLYSKFE